MDSETATSFSSGLLIRFPAELKYQKSPNTDRDVPTEWLENRALYKFDWSQKTRYSCCCCSFLLQLILTAALGSFLFGFNIGLLNTCISLIAWEFEWCDWRNSPNVPITDCSPSTLYQAFLSTAVFVGAAIGSMTGGRFMSYGRRGMMLISAYIFTFGIVTSVCANSFSYLLWARLVCGYAVGLVSVCCPCYISEVTPPGVRGKYGVFHQLFITLGIMIAAVLGLPTGLATPIPTSSSAGPTEIPVLARVWWRVMLGFGLLPSLAMMYLLLKIYTFETPHYYLEQKYPLDAEELLRRILNEPEVTAELRSISDEVQAGQRARTAGMSLGSAIRSSQYRKVIIFGCVLSAFQQLSGINVFMASSTALFTQAGLTGYLAVVMTIVMTVVNCLMTFPAMVLIDRLGRRTLMVWGTIWMTLVVLPAALCYWVLGSDSDVTMWLAIVGSLCFICGFAATYGPILWVYLFEIYPMEIKDAAAGLATAVNWISGIAMVFIMNFLENRILYTIFCAMSAIGTIIVFAFMLETKGRELGDSPFITRKQRG